WVKTWERKETALEPQVGGPYNYPWANDIHPFENAAIRQGLFWFPDKTPWFGSIELDLARFFAPAGAVMNGTARDLLLYGKDSTLLVTAFGYAVQVERAQVQAAAHAFYEQFSSLLQRYRDQGKYPVNTAVEVRYTTVDVTQDLGVAGAAPPTLSASRPVRDG